tara:strand:- start:233 stop:412 length:180 start_codon:yes stop_codon:yes gene_type:complete
MKNVVDKFLALTISKKLTVFAVATILVFNNRIDGLEWVYIALMYIGTQGAIDLYNNIKK